MDPQTQLVVVVGSLSAAVVAVLSTAIGALCYFLRQLTARTIPDMSERFENVISRQLDEMRAQREQCHSDADKIERRVDERADKVERRADERHAEVMAAMHPFHGGLGR